MANCYGAVINSISVRAIALAIIPIFFFGALFVWPLAAILLRALDINEQSNLVELLSDAGALDLILFTIGQAALSTVITLIAGLPVAWLLGRVALPGVALVRVVSTVAFVMPTVVIGVIFSQLFGEEGPLGKLQLNETLWVIIVAHVYMNIAVVARTVGALWSQLDYRSVAAARVLGASPVRAWWTVTVPALAPAIASAAAIVFLFCATSFGVVIVLGAGRYRTVETEIYRQTLLYQEFLTGIALTIVQLVLVSVVAFFAFRFGRLSNDPITMEDNRINPIGREKIAGYSLITVTLLAFLSPLLVMGYRSVHSASAGWTLAGYRGLVVERDGTTPIAVMGYSFLSAVLAMLIAVIVGVVASYLIVREDNWLSPLVSIVMMIPLGVSAVTLGLGYLLIVVALPPELGQSPLVVPLVQALLATVMVVRLIVPALAMISPQLRDAAATLGANGFQVWRTVDIPFLWRPIAVSSGFAMALALGEFGATSFVARPDTTTMTVLIANLFGRPGGTNFAQAMALSVILTMITALIVVIIESIPDQTRRGSRFQVWEK